MTGNVQELTVSELSNALKRTVEDAYSYVRVRGEISGFKRAASGHLYMALKDQDAVIDAVCWRGSASRLMAKPEDGLEVIATGRLTTYPGRSKYQIVIEQIELAGEGALLKLLEERKRRLAEEGLFDPARKKPIPFLPEVIGVVTSPTGAVIRDILHRLADRFPRPVLLWPVLVQGETAAEQVAAAIEGFNRLPVGGAVPRPDVLIVARGGGSLEDLWAFNEEIVVRAAAASAIPLISAVGHETDTTLIDYASDRRAPTPTAAAEMAVPVRSDLLADLAGFEQRLIASVSRGVENRARYLEGLARGLPQPRRLMEPAMQRLDDLSERLTQAPERILRDRMDRLEARAGRLRSPAEQIQRAGMGLSDLSGRMERAARYAVDREQRRFSDMRTGERSLTALTRRLKQDGERLERFGQAVEALSYRGTLKRGYTVVRDAEGTLVTHAEAVTAGMALEIEFTEDKRVSVLAGEGGGAPKVAACKKSEKKTAGPGGGSADAKPKQQDLF